LRISFPAGQSPSGPECPVPTRSQEEDNGAAHYLSSPHVPLSLCRYKMEGTAFTSSSAKQKGFVTLSFASRLQVCLYDSNFVTSRNLLATTGALLLRRISQVADQFKGVCLIDRNEEAVRKCSTKCAKSSIRKGTYFVGTPGLRFLHDQRRERRLGPM
jgi:hypothetical protein